MVVPIRKQMDDLDRKIMDMEKSIALIARHVKDELGEAKKAKPAKPEADVKALKEARDRIGTIEAATRVITTHVKEQLEQNKQELNRVYLQQLLAIKKEMAASAPRESGVEELRSRLNEEIAKLEGFVADSNKVVAEDVERKMGAEIARLEDMIHDSGKLLTEKGMEDYIEKLNKIKHNLERYVNVKVQLVETRLNGISESLKALEAGRDFLQLEEKMAGMDSRLASELGEVKRTVAALGTEEEVQALRHSVNNVSSKLRHFADEKEVEQFKNDVQSIRQSLAAFAPESELVGLEHALKSLRKKMDVFETAEDFQKFRSGIEKHLATEDAAIAETREKLEENMKKLTLDFTLRTNQMKRAVDEETERFKSFVNETELQAIKGEIEDLRRAVDNEGANRMSLEKGVGELEAVIRDTNVRAEMQAIKQAVEEEAANRISIEKNLADIEKALMDMKEKYAGTEKLEQTDFGKMQEEIAAFRESLKGEEREMHLKAMSLITQQLNEFARSMDRRMPELMTKNEFEQSLREIKAKLQSIEAPDMTPLALRVEQLEREVANIANMMHSVYNRLPVVVE